MDLDSKSDLHSRTSPLLVCKWAQFPRWPGHSLDTRRLRTSPKRTDISQPTSSTIVGSCLPEAWSICPHDSQLSLLVTTGRETKVWSFHPFRLEPAHRADKLQQSGLMWARSLLLSLLSWWLVEVLMTGKWSAAGGPGEGRNKPSDGAKGNN